jgi:hypothetical protein
MVMVASIGMFPLLSQHKRESEPQGTDPTPNPLMGQLTLALAPGNSHHGCKEAE